MAAKRKRLPQFGTIGGLIAGGLKMWISYDAIGCRNNADVDLLAPRDQRGDDHASPISSRAASAANAPPDGHVFRSESRRYTLLEARHHTRGECWRQQKFILAEAEAVE
jgi:hypothetical protein